MFVSIFSWLRGLSIVGRTIVGLTTLGVAGAVVLPNIPPTTTAPIITEAEQAETTPVVNNEIVTKTEQVETIPVVTNKIIAETEEIPFDKKTEEDSSLAKGTQQIKTVGVPGIKTLSYNVTYTDDVETKREFIKEETTTQPIDEITVIGTYVEYIAPEPQPIIQSSNCDPNYSGCVPIASDVDCAGGSGNGPAYISGPVQVIGSDIYGLDRDGDGWGCE